MDPEKLTSTRRAGGGSGHHPVEQYVDKYAASMNHERAIFEGVSNWRVAGWTNECVDMSSNRYKYFRWTPRTAWITFVYVVAVPFALGTVAYSTDVRVVQFPKDNPIRGDGGLN